MTTALLAFAAASVLIVLLPGPDTLVVVRGIVRGGRRDAVATVGGVLSGLAIWVAVAALGLSAVLRASNVGYDVLRFLGAAYLIWLGIGSLRGRDADREARGLVEHRRSLLGTGYRAGLATDLLNPKVGVFFMSFMPGFVPHGVDVGSASLAFGAVFIVETALYFAALVGLADRVVRWMKSPRTRRRLDRATGLVFVGLGVRLAAER